MFGRIWNAIASVSTALEAVAQTLNEGNMRLREGFRLDASHEEPEALPDPGNGRKRVTAKGGA